MRGPSHSTPRVSAAGGATGRHGRGCGGWRCETSPSCSSPFPLSYPPPSPARPTLSPPRPTDPRRLTLPGAPGGTPARSPRRAHFPPRLLLNQHGQLPTAPCGGVRGVPTPSRCAPTPAPPHGAGSKGRGSQISGGGKSRAAAARGAWGGSWAWLGLPRSVARRGAGTACPGRSYPREMLVVAGLPLRVR